MGKYLSQDLDVCRQYSENWPEIFAHQGEQLENEVVSRNGLDFRKNSLHERGRLEGKSPLLQNRWILRQ
jgi:hypothetical protein